MAKIIGREKKEIKKSRKTATQLVSNNKIINLKKIVFESFNVKKRNMQKWNIFKNKVTYGIKPFSNKSSLVQIY